MGMWSLLNFLRGLGLAIDDAWESTTLTTSSLVVWAAAFLEVLLPSLTTSSTSTSYDQGFEVGKVLGKEMFVIYG